MMANHTTRTLGFSVLVALAAAFGQAQSLLKGVTQVDPGNTKLTGQTFVYRLTYNCSSTSGPCLAAEVVDLLPIEVQYISTVPASPTGDVSSITVTNNFGGSGRTRVRFVMITPLPAGNSGDLLINVRFPNGSTPDGTTATNTADGINLDTTPGTTTTPPVTVTAVATAQVTVTKTLTTSPATLDDPEAYRLRISNPNVSGALSFTAVGPVTDTLPPGTVFNGATPAADCQPGCVGTTPATVTWTSPCALTLDPNENCDVAVNVTFPSATFPSGTNVTNSFTADGTPLGEPSMNLGIGQVTHAVTGFVPAPNATLAKNVITVNPPTLNQAFGYDIVPANTGNVPLDTMVIVDTLPVEMAVTSVTTGAYVNLSDFAAGEGVRVSYEKNTAPGVFTLWGSSPAVGTNTTLTSPPPGLGAGEYLTRVRWEYGQAQAGMAASSTANRPQVRGTIVNPDNAGGPVAAGDTIQNCLALTSLYTAGPTVVNRNTCRSFVLSGPFSQLNPAKDNLSGVGPFNPGQTVSFRLRVRTAATSSDPIPLETLVTTDLLPADLSFVSWTFDAQGTGLPAPQVFEQIPNFAGTGRTLLRWRWNAGSGNLGINQQVWINLSTTVRTGASFGALTNTMNLEHDSPALGQRCSGSSAADVLDVDGDGNTTEILCTEGEIINVAAIAQLVSSKQVLATCDGGFTGSSSGTLHGGAINYRLHVQNVGTVPMNNAVLVDILPFIGDTGVRDTSPRGSQWEPMLAAPIVPPAGTTVFYSTSGNPCRGEVGGPTTSCDPPGWTVVPPSPITAVKSFKIEFGSRVIGAFDTLDFEFDLFTPGNVAAGLQTYNSFAYQASRADGLGDLAAEPQKVGVALGPCVAASLGDYVWVDDNGDGVQNDGPTGLNGVLTRLFQPGGDGVPGTLDDILVSSTLTGNGPGGAPGWYTFPGLAAGNYFVCMSPPPTFAVTIADQGGDDLDSDIDAVRACTPVIALADDQVYPDLDAGLVATQRAALGNYVWFDRDADGVQDESSWDGANGVTVKLFIDDGDGVPEPGGGDFEVASTVTADDVYGQPGYYLFDGLIPGVRYFVQFIRPASASAFTARNAGGDDALDSDADLTLGTAAPVILAPGAYDPTIDAGLVRPSGPLALGDQVWADDDNDGVYAPQSGELGIDGVRLLLYADANGDGQPTLDEYAGATLTATSGGTAGRYRFSGLAAGTYVVVIDPAAYSGSGALAGMTSSTGNDPAPDPDDDANGDDNGTGIGAVTASLPVTLTAGGEPTADDGDANTNLTVDFGFFTPGTPPPVFDYGDAPDVASGSLTGDYRTIVLDLGAYHRLEVAGAPYLGSCADADDGFNQAVDAGADDVTPAGTVVGSCSGGDDEDGVSFADPFVPGATATFAVVAGGPSACTLDAWVDWDRNGVFGDSAGEQIATSLSVPVGPPTLLSPTVPATAMPGATYARFRCSTAGGLPPTGGAPDGEVEDYALTVVGYDLGDAPASYGTQGVGAASHQVVPGTSVFLGAGVDTELDGQPDAGAAGDDSGAGTSNVGLVSDDEDGVAFTSPVQPSMTTSVDVTAPVDELVLDAWVDFNADGDFGDAGEQVFANQLLAAGVNSLTFVAPADTAPFATIYSRFRVSSGGGLGPTGTAGDGEVEDYVLTTLPVELVSFAAE